MIASLRSAQVLGTPHRTARGGQRRPFAERPLSDPQSTSDMGIMRLYGSARCTAQRTSRGRSARGTSCGASSRSHHIASIACIACLCSPGTTTGGVLMPRSSKAQLACFLALRVLIHTPVCAAPRSCTGISSSRTVDSSSKATCWTSAGRIACGLRTGPERSASACC